MGMTDRAEAPVATLADLLRNKIARGQFHGLNLAETIKLLDDIDELDRKNDALLREARKTEDL